MSSSFKTFLTEIRPTQNQHDDMRTGYKTLKNRLLDDEKLSPIIVSTFLQGSFRRATAVRPKGDKRADVDLVVVTKLKREEYTPQQAMDLFVPFLNKYYENKWEFQGRSIGIGLSYVDLDLVITSAPSEAETLALKSASVTSMDTPEEVDDWRLVPSYVTLSERGLPGIGARLELARKEAEWKLSPLHIPDRDADEWDETHPLAQIKWTWEKNKACNKHYVNVVKAIKWIRRIGPEAPKYPKGYPLEHIIGQCCPDGIASVAEGITKTLEAITNNYSAYAAAGVVPTMPDHGVPAHNVLHRLNGEDFTAFHTLISDAAVIARNALDAKTEKDASEEWRKILGDKFPLSLKTESASKEMQLGATAGAATGGGPRKLKDQPFF
ncbi:MAG TPA: hypothetical protein VN843_03215 [Anaerolineales bacterium]|nr:hypothetical protein [Anaerolineales bacterium]